MRQNNSNSKTRAEELRAQRAAQNGRRNQRTYEATLQAGTASLHANTPARRPAAPSPTRPVVVRNVTSGTAARRPAATASPRRAYYLSLNAPGAEMRLPALPAIHVGWRLLSAALALAAAVGLFSLAISPFFQIGTVTINGLERLTQTDVEAVLDLENLSIIEVTPAEVETELLSRFDSLEAASLSVGLPNNVTLTIQERTPVLAWKQGDTLQWIDAQGVVFQPDGEAGELVIIHSPEPAPVVIPQASAEEAAGTDGENAADSSAKLAKPVDSGPAQLSPEIFAAARKLAERLPAGTPLVYTAAEGLGWEDTSGYDVYIGADLANFEQKFNMVQAIAEQLTQQGVVPELINAENPDAPYYRAEN